MQVRERRFLEALLMLPEACLTSTLARKIGGSVGDFRSFVHTLSLSPLASAPDERKFSLLSYFARVTFCKSVKT